MPSDSAPAQRTVTRRTVLEWLGGGLVLTLGGDWVGGLRAYAAGRKEEGAAGLPFRPGRREGDLFAQWGVRTVDPQELADLLGRWRLEIAGLVEKPGTYSFADLLSLPRRDQTTDFHCVEGWSVFDVPWNGVRLAALLERAAPTPTAAYVNFHTWGDRYNESLPLEVAREGKTMLAFGIDGSTLPLEHGFPLRVVVPRLLGYKNAKYVYRMALAEKPIHGYWVGRGYAYEGEVPPGRLREGKY